MEQTQALIAPKQDWTNRIVELFSELIYPDELDGDEMSFEMFQERLASTLNEAGRVLELNELNKRKTTAPQVEIEGKVYKRLKQFSSETYYGLYGSYHINEPLYREQGIRNGPTVRVLRRRIGAITNNMTPRLARIVGEMSADLTSREILRLLTTIGCSPPSRAYLEKHLKKMAVELSGEVAALESGAQAADTLPEKIAGVSSGIDRKSVPMEERLPQTASPRPLKKPRRKPYQRKVPPPIEVNHRMMWGGSVTAYDSDGDALKTWRMATDASAEVSEFAARVTSQVATIARSEPNIPIVVIQDGAKELRALPEQVRDAVANTDCAVHQRIDFIHLLKYLTDVVKACEPPGDPRRMRDWYCHELLRDDNAIQRIYQSLRRKLSSYERLQERGKSLDHAQQEAYDAVKAAVNYIKHRRPFMRYASLREQNLPIASGATESTCKLMGQRTNRSGMRWREPGLRGILTIRGLVLSEQWNLVWRLYADSKRTSIQTYDLAA